MSQIIENLIDASALTQNRQGQSCGSRSISRNEEENQHLRSQLSQLQVKLTNSRKRFVFQGSLSKMNQWFCESLYLSYEQWWPGTRGMNKPPIWPLTNLFVEPGIPILNNVLRAHQDYHISFTSSSDPSQGQWGEQLVTMMFSFLKTIRIQGENVVEELFNLLATMERSPPTSQQS